MSNDAASYARGVADPRGMSREGYINMAKAKKERNADTVGRLRGLPAGSPEQIDYALHLVETGARLDLAQAALDVLADTADPRVRPALLAGYALCSSGASADPGCYLRVALLQALRPLVRKADGALLEGAVLTYEFTPPFTPPHRGESAAGLRSVALVVLNEIDETLAGYHGVRLLTDRYTSPMSGEPAVTAVRLLRAQGHALPLYDYLLRDGDGVAEVVGECLRSLDETPASILAPLVERYREDEDEIVLLGLFDLLLTREDHASYTEEALTFLETTRLYNVYRYVVNTIVARRRTSLIAALDTMLAGEKDRMKAEILREALALR